MNVKLVRDSGGEWEGLYINGVLAVEGHSLDAWQVVEALAGPGWQEIIDMDAANLGRLPIYHSALDGLDRV